MYLLYEGDVLAALGDGAYGVQGLGARHGEAGRVHVAGLYRDPYRSRVLYLTVKDTVLQPVLWRERRAEVSES